MGVEKCCVLLALLAGLASAQPKRILYVSVRLRPALPTSQVADPAADVNIPSFGFTIRLTYCASSSDPHTIRTRLHCEALLPAGKARSTLPDRPCHLAHVTSAHRHHSGAQSHLPMTTGRNADTPITFQVDAMSTSGTKRNAAFKITDHC
jgi:hypothetical protein